VLSGRGLCDELITRPEESYRLWFVVVCDIENLLNDEVLAHRGAVAPNKKSSVSEKRLERIGFSSTFKLSPLIVIQTLMSRA